MGYRLTHCSGSSITEIPGVTLYLIRLGSRICGSAGGHYGPTLTVASVVLIPKPPSSSVTVNSTSYKPSVEYTWVTLCPLAADPSRKSHEKVWVSSIPGSLKVALKVMVLPSLQF